MSDIAREYFGKPILDFLQNTGCNHIHQEIYVRVVAERTNSTLLKATRAALTHALLPRNYWHYVILDAPQK